MVQAAGAADTGAARDALAHLCESYWYPLYAFVRRSGHDVEAARDLTQGFFARVLERGDIQSADRERGRFRSFLLLRLKSFLANERERERALKRGGGRAPLSIDASDLEQADARYRHEPAHELTPEKLYLRSWALALSLIHI